MKKKIFLIMILLFSLVLVSCTDDKEPDKPVNPESIEFVMEEYTLTPGSYELKVKVLPEGANQGVSFSLVGVHAGVTVDRGTLYITEQSVDGAKFTVSANSTFDPAIKGTKEFTISNEVVAVEKTEIKTEAELRNMALDGHYILMNNIELTEEWEPIGIPEFEQEDGTILEGEYFNGSFDGNGYTISGIEINGTFNAGFFAQIGPLGVVENVAFEGTVEASGWSGGVAGINVGLIQNVISNMKVNVAGTSAGSIVSVNRGVIQYVYGIGKVSSESNNNTMGRSAGLVVANDGNMVEVYGDKDTLESPNYLAFQPVTNPNYMLSTVEMKLKETFVNFDEDIWYLEDGTYPLLKHEGFVPPVIDPELILTIDNETTEFDLEETDEVLVLVNLRNGTGEETLLYSLVEAVAGVAISPEGLMTFDLGLVSASFTATVVVSVEGTDVSATKTFSFVYNPVPQEEVIEISTAAELLNLLSGQTNPETLAKKFVLLNDIELDEDWVSIGIAPNDDEGIAGVPFTGEFDGNGFEISGINMPGGGYNKGFFGYIGEDAVVKNTKFTGYVEANAWSGALAANNSGLVKDVILNMTVYVYGGNGGALIEHNHGTVENVIVTGKAAADSGPSTVGLFVTNFGTYTNVFAKESTLTTNVLVTVGSIVDEDGDYILSDEAFISAATYSDFDSEIWNIVEGEVPTLK